MKELGYLSLQVREVFIDTLGAYLIPGFGDQTKLKGQLCFIDNILIRLTLTPIFFKLLFKKQLLYLSEAFILNTAR
jgi:hypothetical protein